MSATLSGFPLPDSNVQLPLIDLEGRVATERFERRGEDVGRVVHYGHRVLSETWLKSPGTAGTAHEDFDAAWLRSPRLLRTSEPRREVRVADLFSGCGGLSLGVDEAARALGMAAVTVLASDTDTAAADVYSRNFHPHAMWTKPVERLLDGDLGADVTESERKLKFELGNVDLVVAGPPCQGHSDLNNHTRRDDPKNSLYLRVARFAEVVRPQAVIIENVPNVVKDRRGVVATTISRLEALGYYVSADVLRAVDLGVPQTRRRYVLVGTLTNGPTLRETATALAASRPRSFDWACSDLFGEDPRSAFESAATHTAVNRERIEFLFRNGLYDLPDANRPDCHRLKPHSYRAVYGRMRGDKPAPTITAGFGSTGQGRFVHPHEPRTLTPREASRIQFFPDWFDFGNAKRRALQQMIGNAVPPKLGYVAAMAALVGLA